MGTIVDCASKGAVMMAPSDDRIVPPLDAEVFREAKALPNGVERLRVHRRLLVECLRRLRAGRQLERDHGVIHPEMTAIVRDVVRLTDLVFPEVPTRGTNERDEQPIAFLSKGRADFAQVVSKYSSARVAKRLCVNVSTVNACANGSESPSHAMRSRIESAFGVSLGSWEEEEDAVS